MCVLFRSFPSLDQTPQCDPCVTFSHQLAEAGLALQASPTIYTYSVLYSECFNLALEFVL